MIDILATLPARSGHFLLESGYHTDLWLTLDALFLEPTGTAPLVSALADKLRPYGVTAMCGPLLGGAFLVIFFGREYHNPEFKLIFWVPQLLVLGFCFLLLLYQPTATLVLLWGLSASIVTVLMGWPRIEKAVERSKQPKLGDFVGRT